MQEVLEGSPAEAAGVQAGDVLVGLDDARIADLRGYSAALKAHAPGDEVTLRVRRGEEELTLRAVLARR